jgi:hypothetical protein
VFAATEEAEADAKPDKATKEERADKVYRLSGKDGKEFLTPPPKAVKAKHDSKEAKAATEGPGDLSPAMKAQGPSKATFGLYSDPSRDIGPDGKETNQRVSVPAWVVTFASSTLSTYVPVLTIRAEPPPAAPHPCRRRRYRSRTDSSRKARMARMARSVLAESALLLV